MSGESMTESVSSLERENALFDTAHQFCSPGLLNSSLVRGDLKLPVEMGHPGRGGLSLFSHQNGIPLALS